MVVAFRKSTTHMFHELGLITQTDKKETVAVWEIKQQLSRLSHI